jgi:hypothetical protein
MIRPLDPVLDGQMALTYMLETPSHLAVRHLLQLAFKEGQVDKRRATDGTNEYARVG